ncbi:MAG TPA: hypothetical protein VIG99_11470 [Myxococcaceae bacterium]
MGGATTNFGGVANAPQAAAGGLNVGSTLDTNLLLSGLGKVLSGTGEMLQSAGNGLSAGDLSAGGYTPLSGTNVPDFSTLNTGLPNLGNQGTGGGLDAIVKQLNDLVNQLSAMVNANPAPQAPAPAPAPAPQVDPIANLVNRANVAPQLQNAVTQVAQDPVGNKLLQGAVNGGLTGIQVANMPAGFFGQTLPETGQVQIAPQTVQGNDLLRTITHELVHAATLRDGDSLKEENVADQLGTQLQQRLTGFGPGYILGGEAYNGLPQDNGITNALRLLGITI